MEGHRREPGTPLEELKGRNHVQGEPSERRKSSLPFPVLLLNPPRFRRLHIIENLEIKKIQIVS